MPFQISCKKIQCTNWDPLTWICFKLNWFSETANQTLLLVLTGAFLVFFLFAIVVLGGGGGAQFIHTVSTSYQTITSC